MIELIFRNLLILYLGTFLRFLFHRFIKRNKQITFHFILNGIGKEKTKEDEIFNVVNVNISHYGDILSGNDATGNVINIHSLPERASTDQHRNKTYNKELDGILRILGKGGTKLQVKQKITEMYKQWDAAHSQSRHSSVE